MSLGKTVINTCGDLYELESQQSDEMHANHVLQTA